MKVRECPHCKQDHLVFTGAFWSCGDCGYAITGFALAAEEAGSGRQGIRSSQGAMPKS